VNVILDIVNKLKVGHYIILTIQTYFSSCNYLNEIISSTKNVKIIFKQKPIETTSIVSSNKLMKHVHVYTIKTFYFCYAFTL